MDKLALDSHRTQDLDSVLHPQTNLRRHMDVGPHIITSGTGIFIQDTSGAEYLDAAAGLWCASLGFSSDRLAEVAKRAMSDLGYYQIFRHASHPAAIELCARLVEMAPVKMSKALLQCSGSEANDTALKLVWYYWNNENKPAKRKIISRTGSYHGSTCATACLTGKPEFHAGFGLPWPEFLYTPHPDFRKAQSGETEEQYSSRLASELEELILKEGPETIAAFWADALQGSVGVLIPPASYFAKIQAVLKKYDILYVADEVITGFGRAGAMWASELYDIKPDLLTCAKALSAGMQPISAVLINERIFSAMASQSDRLGRFVHGYTYSGHPVATAVALETLKIYEEMPLVSYVKGVEPTFLGALSELGEHPLVSDFCGVGLIGGLQLRFAEKPTLPAGRIGELVDNHAREAGLILRIIGDRVALSPPLIITDEEIGTLKQRLLKALDGALKELRVGAV